MKRKHKALIKDLELQIDYLVAYSPQGLHWKQEYHFRNNLINEVLMHEQTPQEVVDKIARIQEKIFELKRKDAPGAQDYLKGEQEEFKKPHKVQVNDYLLDEPYYIEI